MTNELDAELMNYLEKVVGPGLVAAIAATSVSAGIMAAVEHPEWAAAFAAMTSYQESARAIAANMVSCLPIALEQEPQQ